MKLLQINSVVNTGSTGRIAEDIGKIAMTSGWESYIAFGRKSNLSQSELIKIGNNWDIFDHGLKTRLFDLHGLGSKSATKTLINKITNIQPDIIHLHNLHGYFINFEILFKYLQKTNIPLVWTLHDCWPITGHCSYFTFAGCNKWKSQCKICPQKSSYPTSWLIDRSEENFILKKKLFTSLSDITLVPVSKWLSEILKESFLNKYPIKVIHNGINTNIFKPQIANTFRSKHGLERHFLILGVANEWSPRKGLEDFIAMSKLLNDDSKVVLIGLSLKQKKELPEKILGIEKTESMEELAEIYSACDVFVNPTYEDNFPTTNLESLACGTPVITYNTGGSPEAIDESTGIVIEQGDINGILASVALIKEKKKQFHTLTCVNRIHRLFKNNDRFNEYLNLYESLL